MRTLIGAISAVFADVDGGWVVAMSATDGRRYWLRATTRQAARVGRSLTGVVIVELDANYVIIDARAVTAKEAVRARLDVSKALGGRRIKLVEVRLETPPLPVSKPFLPWLDERLRADPELAKMVEERIAEMKREKPRRRPRVVRRRPARS